MNLRNKVIGLITDFGTKDPYVAVMKAVILNINPYVTIVDISHDIEKFKIVEASFILTSAIKYFPKNTIFVVVVDPGVGSERKALIIRTRNHILVGPDNGVLVNAAVEDGVECVYEIFNKDFLMKPISHTFHGRDIFAPTAAYLSLDVPLEVLGRKISFNDIVKPVWFTYKVSEDLVEGHFIYFDSFGNASTNIPANKVGWLKYGSKVKITVYGKVTLETKFLRFFGEVSAGETLLLVNSFGFLELAVNLGSARRKYNLKYGDKVIIEKME